MRAADVVAGPGVLALGDALWGAVDNLNQSGLDGMAVVDGGRFVGMVTRESIAEVIRHRLGGGEPAGPGGTRR